MTPEQLPVISVVEPISLAMEKVKALLFRPFDLSRWFTIGFCVWLALLGQNGPNFQFNVPFHNWHNPGFSLGQARHEFSEHFLVIIIVASIGLLIGLAIMIVLLWLSCRGRFMFLYCVAQNKAEVKTPWNKFRKSANSLLLFKLVAGLVAFICIALCIAMFAMMIFLLTRNHARSNIAEIFAMVCLSFIIALTAIVFSLFFKFTNDFVIPIMYLRTCSCTEAWSQFLRVLSFRKGAFALYILFQIVIAMVIAAILITVVFGTCCCAACFLAIPYIGTVLMLPLLVFKRAYSLYYLRQFGPDFDVFTTLELEGNRDDQINMQQL